MIAAPRTPNEGFQTIPDSELRWFQTADRVPATLEELGKPLVCFHRDRGFYFACYLPEKQWYWTGERVQTPERWAPSEGGARSWRYRASGVSNLRRAEYL